MAEPGVLAIDDSEDILEVLGDFFSANDVPFHPARDVETGLRLLGSERIGFVLLDVHMPGITGDVALLALKQRRPKLRVAIMSGFLDAGLERQLTDLGASRIFSKPLRLDDVLQEAQISLAFDEG